MIKHMCSASTTNVLVKQPCGKAGHRCRLMIGEVPVNVKSASPDHLRTVICNKSKRAKVDQGSVNVTSVRDAVLV